MKVKGSRDEGSLRDGLSDKLEPLEPLDLKNVKTIDELVIAMSKTALSARGVGEAADLLYDMTKEDCYVVGTFSGVMTVAKMGLVLCDMIEHDMLNAVVSTGALISHGLVESKGMLHFKHDKEMDDKTLYHKGYDRIHDSVELERNLDDVEIIIDNVLNGIDHRKPIGSWQICGEIGKYLSETTKERGILKSAYENRVPVFIPAFTDSELGLDFAIHNKKRNKCGLEELRFDPFIDLDYYADTIKNKESIGIFTIGGGVPRNWAQQVCPYLDILEKRMKQGSFKRFKYGIRICPEPVHFGGLSGSTYSEGVSWGKFVPKDEDGRFVEVLSEATIARPLIVKAVMERLEKV